MYVNVTLNLVVQRLRALFPQWLTSANCFVSAGPDVEPVLVGNTWLEVFYAGSSFDTWEGGNVGRRWRLGVAYFYKWQAGLLEAATVQAQAVNERMRAIMGHLDPTGPTGLHLWEAPAVPTLAFTGGGTSELLPDRTIVQNAATQTASQVAGVSVTGGSWTGGDAAGLIFLGETVRKLSFTGGGPVEIQAGKTIKLHSGNATGRVVAVGPLTAGTSWAAGTAAGNLWLAYPTGTWGGGQIDQGSDLDVATAGAIGTAGTFTTGQLDTLAYQASPAITGIATAGALGAEQVMSEPMHIVTEGSIRLAPTKDGVVTVQQEYEVYSLYSGGEAQTWQNSVPQTLQRSVARITNIIPGATTQIYADPPYGFGVGDILHLDGIGGMSGMNGIDATVHPILSDSFTILFNSLNMSAYTGGGLAVSGGPVW